MTRRSLLASAIDGDGFVRETGSYRSTIVLDNLIAKGDMPITVSISEDLGVTPEPNGNAQPRYNRSLEYDAVEDGGITYFSGPEKKRLWRVDVKGNKSAVNGEVEYPNGVRSSRSGTPPKPPVPKL